MEFVKEFAIFLHKNDIIKFGDFTLTSGKNSSYYIDLRLVPSYPHQFRKMVKNLQNLIIEKTGLDNFDSLASDNAYTPLSLSKFIGLCNYIKSSLLICDIHHNLESDIDEVVCKECENMLLKGPGSVY